MTSLIKRTFWVSTLLILSVSAKAQLNITEYYSVSKAFKLNLKNRVEEKSVYSKGVLNIEFDADRLQIAVTYDPKQTSINDAMRHILTQTGGDIIKHIGTEENLSKDNSKKAERERD